jgi:hypothetical protein
MAWEFRGPNPHMDSPLMVSPMTDQSHVVLRMKYEGSSASTVGSFYFRSGSSLPPPLYAKVGKALVVQRVAPCNIFGRNRS